MPHRPENSRRTSRTARPARLWDLVGRDDCRSPTRELAIGWLIDVAGAAALWGAATALPGSPATLSCVSLGKLRHRVGQRDSPALA